MENHRGKFVKKVIQEEGFSISKVAKTLRVTRVTLYNQFKKPNLSRDFILKVGKVIKYDFSLDFPEMQPKSTVPTIAKHRKEYASYGMENVLELLTMEKKYTRLLDYHNQLLSLLIQIIDPEHLILLKEEMDTLSHQGIKATINH